MYKTIKVTLWISEDYLWIKLQSQKMICFANTYCSWRKSVYAIIFQDGGIGFGRHPGSTGSAVFFFIVLQAGSALSMFYGVKGNTKNMITGH